MKALCIGGCAEGTVKEVPNNIGVYEIKETRPLVMHDATKPISTREPTIERVYTYRVAAMSIGDNVSRGVAGLLIEHSMTAETALQRLIQLCGYFASRKSNRTLDKNGLAACPFCKGPGYVELTGASASDIYGDRFFCGCKPCGYHLRPMNKFGYVRGVGYTEVTDARQQAINVWNHQP
jgi:hypothetical protein